MADRAVDHKGEVLHASRPGMKTLIGVFVLIALFVAIKFSDTLMSLLTFGR